MLGVNEVRSNEDIPTNTVIALCEGLLSRMEEPDMRRMVKTDKDRYYRSLKTQFKRLDDRYPGIFHMLIQYGRINPQGLDIMEQITTMLRQRDAIFAKMKQNPELSREDAGAQEDKAVYDTYDYRYVRPAFGEERFDNIMKNAGDKMKNAGDKSTQ